MATYNKFNCYVQDLHEGRHDFRVDALKVALTNVQPLATDSSIFQVSEIAPLGGYQQGGIPLTILSSQQENGVHKLTIEDFTFVASGSVGPFRYQVIHNSSSDGQRLICWFDYGYSVTLLQGDSFFFDFSQQDGLYTLT